MICSVCGHAPAFLFTGTPLCCSCLPWNLCTAFDALYIGDPWGDP